MASPFAVFRKQQKTLLAVLGVMCMIAFVFGSTQCTGPTTGPTANAVVASTKYGDLREGDLYEMRMEAITVDRFLSTLVARTSQALIEEQPSLAQFQQQIFMNLFNSLQGQGMILFGDENRVDETILVDTMLLARRAQQNGVVITDRAINEFLGQITQEKLSRDDLVAIVNEMKVNQGSLFEGLRRRLAARSMRQMFVFGLANSPPAEKWEYYLRLNRRARTEMVAVPVASLMDEVKTPDEETVRSFFEKHKDEIRRPGSPEPGFKQPHQVALQYLKADYEQFMDEDAITQEEIEAHYEKFKDTRYLFTEPTEEPTDEASQEQPEKSPSEAEKSEKATEKKPAAEAEKSEADKDDAGNSKPSEVKKEGEKASNDNKSEDQAPDSESPKPGQSDSSQCGDDAQEAAAEQQPEKKEQPAGSETANPDGKQDEQKTDDSQPAAATPGSGEQADTEAKPEEPSLLELSGQLSLPQSISDGPRPKHNPLWRVEKDIRRELAGQKASEKITEVFQQIKPVLDAYFDSYTVWKSEHPDLKEDEEHPRPPRPDFAELAKKHGLTAHETGLLSIYEVTTDTDVGQALAEMGQRLQRSNYVQAVLETPPLYKAFSVQDLPGNQYLYWKVNDVAEHVPSLTDEGIRDEVVEAWKEIQARDLAEKKAKQIVEQANSGKPMSELVSENDELKLIETQPFTWMTAGSPFLGPSMPQMTSIPGVESPGDDFMQTVFSLEEGKAAIAFNEPKSVAYAVRVTSLEPSLSVLRETFAVESPRQAQNFMALSQQDNFEATRKWIEGVREDAGLHWNRPAVDLAMRN